MNILSEIYQFINLSIYQPIGLMRKFKSIKEIKFL